MKMIPARDEIFHAGLLRLVELLGRPFKNDTFDFFEKLYFEKLFRFGHEISTMKKFRESKKARGIKDVLYINRTYYGLYNLLHKLELK